MLSGDLADGAGGVCEAERFGPGECVGGIGVRGGVGKGVTATGAMSSALMNASAPSPAGATSTACERLPGSRPRPAERPSVAPVTTGSGVIGYRLFRGA